LITRRGAGSDVRVINGTPVISSTEATWISAGGSSVACASGSIGVGYFGLRPASIADYGGKVQWRFDGRSGNLSPGQWVQDRNSGFIEDDPTKQANSPTSILVPSLPPKRLSQDMSRASHFQLASLTALDDARLGGLAPLHSAPFAEPDLSSVDQARTEVLLKQVDEDPGNPKPYEELAKIFGYARLRIDASLAIEAALSADSHLRSMNSHELEYMLRAVGQPGDRPSLDRPDLVRAIALELKRRKPTLAGYYDAIVDVIECDAALNIDDSTSIGKLTTSARKLLAFGQSADLLMAGEALFRAGCPVATRLHELAVDHEATKALQTYLGGSNLSRRERAEGFERLGESYYWDDARKRESVAATNTAVSLWARPHWLVHLAAREAETGIADASSFDLLSKGLEAQPSADSTIRACVFLFTVMQTEEDHDRAMRMSRWAFSTYENVSEVLKTLGMDLSTDNPAFSKDLFIRAVDLMGGEDKLTDVERAALAADQFWVESQQGERPDAMAIARQHHILGSGRPSGYAARYFAAVGDLASALRLLPSEQMNIHQKDVMEGQWAHKTGRFVEARDAFERSLATAGDAGDSIPIAEARVGLAEIQGQATAERLLSSSWDRDINLNWTSSRYRHLGLFYRARLLWAARRRSEAIVLMKQFAAVATKSFAKAETSRILESWEKPAASTPPPSPPAAPTRAGI